MRGGRGTKFPLTFYMYKEMISVILEWSGTLQLDLSVRFHRRRPAAQYNHLIVHLRRTHILDLDSEYDANFPFHLSPFAHTPELLNIRHLYANKGYAFGSAPLLRSFSEKSTLETLYFETSGLFRVPILPTSRLRYCHIWQEYIDQHTAQLVNE